jgi:NADH-quinone oxidoreductase subunit J
MTPQIILFSAFALIMLSAAMMVIVARNPVHGALFLVVAFVAAAGLWMLLEAEFLSLVLILVYVGAVMTLFLFVVMMLNLDRLPGREAFWRYLPFALVIGILLVGITVMSITPKHLPLVTQAAVSHGADYSNTKALGAVLYTDYVYAFELAAVILLASIIAAISLAFRGRQPNTKGQRAEKQIATRREESVKVVKMKSEGKQS